MLNDVRFSRGGPSLPNLGRTKRDLFYFRLENVHLVQAFLVSRSAPAHVSSKKMLSQENRLRKYDAKYTLSLVYVVSRYT